MKSLTRVTHTHTHTHTHNDRHAMAIYRNEEKGTPQHVRAPHIAAKTHAHTQKKRTRERERENAIKAASGVSRVEADLIRVGMDRSFDLRDRRRRDAANANAFCMKNSPLRISLIDTPLMEPPANPINRRQPSITFPPPSWCQYVLTAAILFAPKSSPFFKRIFSLAGLLLVKRGAGTTDFADRYVTGSSGWPSESNAERERERETMP